MKPIEFIKRHGIDYFTQNKEKTITVRLLSDDGYVFSGYFVGITPVGEVPPMIDGLLIELPLFKIQMMYNNPDDGKIIPVSFNLLLIDDMKDIAFS